jgi:transcriptional regulator with XRE-family HTH domain
MATDILRAQTLGEAMRLLMQRAGMTRDDLAEASGVSAGSMSRYLANGGVPPSRVLLRITKVLADRLDVASDAVWVAFASILDEEDAGAVIRARTRARKR